MYMYIISDNCMNEHFMNVIEVWLAFWPLTCRTSPASYPIKFTEFKKCLDSNIHKPGLLKPGSYTDFLSANERERSFNQEQSCSVYVNTKILL